MQTILFFWDKSRGDLAAIKQTKVLSIHFQTGGESSYQLTGKAGLDQVLSSESKFFPNALALALCILVHGQGMCCAPFHVTQGTAAPPQHAAACKAQSMCLPMHRCDQSCIWRMLSLKTCQFPQFLALQSYLLVLSYSTGLYSVTSPPVVAQPSPVLSCPVLVSWLWLRLPCPWWMVQPHFSSLDMLLGEQAVAAGHWRVWVCRCLCTQSHR